MTLEERFRALTRHRQEHSERVAEVMRTLADRHHFDQDRAQFAGWAHDLAREMSRPELLEAAGRLGLPIGAAERAEPLLLHGPVAAAWVAEAGRGDEAVLEAIRYHTTGGQGLSPLAKALFIADGVEPGRQYPARPSLYQRALTQLDDGYCAVLMNTQAYLEERGLRPHPDMLSALKECSSPLR